jgi:hypothetical protein
MPTASALRPPPARSSSPAGPRASGAPGRPERLVPIAFSARDRLIIALTRRKLGGAAPAFDEALRALREAVEEVIPAGRVYLLGAAECGPIVGSLVSSVAIVDGEGGVALVRVGRDGQTTALGRLAP